jgi:phospholipase A1
MKYCRGSKGILAVALAITPCFANAAQDLDTCLLDALRNADKTATVAEIKAFCEGEGASAAAVATEQLPVYERSIIEERFDEERELERRPFVITPHNPTYFTASYFDDPNQAPFEEVTGISAPLEDSEVNFQISIKAPLWRNVFGSNTDAYFAYTARSWWQLSNDDVSSPFRETNYQPEFFFRNFTQHDFLGLTLAGWSLGFVHESNGRADPLSRSWNRIMARFGVQASSDLTFLVRAWHRIEEDEEDDDNPNMHRYYGYGDIRAIWTPNRNTITAMLRPGTAQTSYELTWSYPISPVFRVYAQYYKGYGESLLDYDYDNERIGIGIALNDYLMRR